MSASKYESPIKRTHRASVLELAHGSRFPLLYLDDETGGATSFFLERHVSTKRLCPVNFCPTAVRGIEKRTRVDAVCANIDHVVKTARAQRKRYSVVWLDYECTKVRKNVLQDALAVAPFVVITLSARGVSKEIAVPVLERTVAEAGGRLLEDPVKYKGASDIKNMLRAVVASHSVCSGEKALPRRGDGHRTLRHASKKKGTPCGGAQGKEKDDCFATEQCDSTHCTLPFGHRGLCSHWRVNGGRRRGKPLTPAMLVGTDVYMPAAEWKTPADLAAYAGVKRCNDRLQFRIVGTYYKALRLRAVMKNGRMAATDECWCLSLDAVLRYCQ